MARGTVVGEGIVSQASTDNYRAGHDAALGERKPRQRGKWVWDEQAKALVRAGDYRPPARAINAPIIADRIHEGTVSPIDGSDIGSRSKRRAHMKAHGVEDATDASPAWREGIKKEQERQDNRSRRAAMERAARQLYQQGKWR